MKTHNWIWRVGFKNKKNKLMNHFPKDRTRRKVSSKLWAWNKIQTQVEASLISTRIKSTQNKMNAKNKPTTNPIIWEKTNPMISPIWKAVTVILKKDPRGLQSTTKLKMFKLMTKRPRGLQNKWKKVLKSLLNHS